MVLPDDAPALRVRGLSHRFGPRVALDELSLDVPAGSFVALLGPNGAGKTTLFSHLTRFLPNAVGQVKIFGHDLCLAPAPALAALGVVFQARTVDPDLSVVQNLVYHATLHGLAGRDVKRRIDALLAFVDLADRARDKIRDLSGGQVRRIEIVRALVHAPRLLLLDEPTVGLDLASRRMIATLVRRLIGETSLSVLWATHLLDEIEMADAVTILHRGCVRASGAAADIIANQNAASLEQAFGQLTRDGASGAAA